MAVKELPSSFKIKGHIIGKVFEDTPDTVFLSFSNYGVATGYFKVKDVDVEISLTWTEDPTLMQVAALRSAITSIQAEAYKATTALQSQINQLLQITHTEVLDANKAPRRPVDDVEVLDDVKVKPIRPGGNDMDDDFHF